MQPCSVAKFLSALYKIPLEESYLLTGLVLCPICSKASREPERYPFCSGVCERNHNKEKTGGTWLTMICEGCGEEYQRQRSEVEGLGRAGKPMPRFCSRKCRSRFLGATYGFGGHHKSPVWQKLTHCKRGHLMEGSNITWHEIPRKGSGRWVRMCRPCRHVRDRERYQRLRKSQG